MPGSIYNRNLRLARAFAEGQDAAVAGALATANPHPVGSPAYTAWAAGWTDGSTLACDVYAGGAACTGVATGAAPGVAPLPFTLSPHEAEDTDTGKPARSRNRSSSKRSPRRPDAD